MNEFVEYLQKNLREMSAYGLVVFLILALIFFFAGFFVCRIQNASLLKKIRKDSIKRSRAVIGGQMVEQIAPFLPDFPCNPADCRFLGKPVDIVAFCGASEKDKIEEIIFIEVKTGESQLSNREKEIRECIKKGKVRYEVYRWSAKS